jgi:hypothetical protein
VTLTTGACRAHRLAGESAGGPRWRPVDPCPGLGRRQSSPPTSAPRPRSASRRRSRLRAGQFARLRRGPNGRWVKRNSGVCRGRRPTGASTAGPRLRPAGPCPKYRPIHLSQPVPNDLVLRRARQAQRRAAAAVSERSCSRPRRLACYLGLKSSSRSVRQYHWPSLDLSLDNLLAALGRRSDSRGRAGRRTQSRSTNL